MPDTCQACGCEVDEWELDEDGLCRDCADEFTEFHPDIDEEP